MKYKKNHTQNTTHSKYPEKNNEISFTPWLFLFYFCQNTYFCNCTKYKFNS